MFGYVTPDAPYLFKKDEVLYNALYCGLCKSIGKGCGQIARTTLTYDISFVSALMHNISGQDIQIKKQRCMMHWIKRRPMAQVDDLTVSLGCVNAALAYFKLLDDKKDGEKRGVFRHLYSGGFKRALKRNPQLVKLIEEYYLSQEAVEKKNSSIIDEAAEPTAQLMQSLSDELLKELATEHTRKLFYNLGKWVYLIDALDDYDKDVKKGNYNVFKNAYGEQNRQDAFKKGEKEIIFIFDSIFIEMRNANANINYKFNHDLTDNIILRGIPLKTRKIFYGDENCCKGAKNEQKKS